MDKFKSWLIPGIIVIIAIGGLVLLRGRIFEAGPGEGVRIEEAEKTKGFAKPQEPSPKEKIRNDNAAMADALYSGNITDCDKITWDEELKKQCEDNLNYAAILRSGDETRCDTLHDENLKEQCRNQIYLSAAADEKDITICDLITDESMEQLCKDQVQALLSRFADSAADCESISSDILKTQCLDNFQLRASAETLNVENCDNISDETLSEQCKESVTRNLEIIEESRQAAEEMKVYKSPQEMLAICDTLSAIRAVTCKDAVYPALAFDEKDLSYCDKISDDLVAADCSKQTKERIDQFYLSEATTKEDKSFCENISDPDVKNLCLR